MIELKIKQHFDGILSVPCFFMTPEDPPVEYVLIERTGGAVENFVKNATFAFQSISGNSLLRAIQINAQVIDAANTLPTVTNIFSAQENSTYNYTDTNTKQFRYQTVFDVTYME